MQVVLKDRDEEVDQDDVLDKKINSLEEGSDEGTRGAGLAPFTCCKHTHTHTRV